MADSLGISSDLLKQYQNTLIKSQMENALKSMDPLEQFKSKTLANTTLGDIGEYGLGNFFNKISLGDITRLYSLYQTNRRFNKEMDILDQNAKIAKANHLNQVKALNNAKEKSRVIGDFLAGRTTVGNYDESDYQ